MTFSPVFWNQGAPTQYSGGSWLHWRLFASDSEQRPMDVMLLGYLGGYLGNPNGAGGLQDYAWGLPQLHFMVLVFGVFVV